jgi:geranylgeranyl reductase family protein
MLPPTASTQRPRSAPASASFYNRLVPVDDVAVVGGGPAGAWCAYRLACQGARVRLFDASHPREKPCGGGVTARAFALVAPALAGVSLPAVSITAARFELGERGARVPLGASGPHADLLVVSRAAFDGALLRAAVAAGARHVSERVVDVEVTPSGATLRTAAGLWRARWVVGADGAASLVRRRLARPFARRQLSIAAGYFVGGCTSREVVVQFDTAPPGYLWAFPRADHLAVGVCAQADAARSDALRARTLAWVQTQGLARAPLTPYAWPIPSLAAEDWDREQPAGERWMLVGDAAGLVDPITREGIYFALASAEAAAAALAGPRSPVPTYRARLADTLYPELRRAARLKRGFYRRSFLDLLVQALAASPAVRDVMRELVAGRQPYATLARRLLATLELRLAWRLVRLELAGR